MPVFMGFVIFAAVALQFIAAFLSLRLIKVSRVRLPWILISMTAFLMGVRRLMDLTNYFQGAQLGAASELLAFVISALLLVGVATIAPLLVSMRRHEEELKALSFTDELTDLYNRRGLGTLADHLIAQADRTKVGVFLL